MPGKGAERQRLPGKAGVKRKVASPTAKRTKRTGARRRSAKVQRVDDVGDTVFEHDFDDSSDEEEEEIRNIEAERRRHAAEAAAKGKRQVFVTGIPWSASEDAIRKYFKSCGDIADVNYPTHEDAQRPKGFAFVTFETEQSVAKAILFDGRDFEGRKLGVKVVSKKSKRRGKSTGGGSDSEGDDGDEDDDDADDSGSEELNSDDEESDSEDRRASGKGKRKGAGKGKGKRRAKAGGKGKGKGSGKGKGR